MKKPDSILTPTAIIPGVCIGLGVIWASSAGLPFWGGVAVAAVAGVIGTVAASWLGRRRPPA